MHSLGQRRKAEFNKNLDDVATVLGFEREGRYGLKGVYGQIEFSIRRWVPDKNSRNVGVHTLIVAHLNPPLGLELDITTENFSALAMKTLGDKEIKTGDDHFDERFFIKAKDKEGALALLNLECRTALNFLYESTDAKTSSPIIVLDDMLLRYEKGERFEADFLSKALETQFQAARLLIASTALTGSLSKSTKN